MIASNEQSIYGACKLPLFVFDTRVIENFWCILENFFYFSQPGNLSWYDGFKQNKEIQCSNQNLYLTPRFRHSVEEYSVCAVSTHTSAVATLGKCPSISNQEAPLAAAAAHWELKALSKCTKEKLARIKWNPASDVDDNEMIKIHR